MNKVKILDCTLRDGGYINDCNFGYDNLIKIIRGLENAKIDIIECGYLRDVDYNEDKSEFPSMDFFSKKVTKKRDKSKYVLMGIYGEYDYNKLPDYKPSYADGIRVTFHREERAKALEAVGVIEEKGYKLFIQPTATLGYSDYQLLEMVEYCNRIKPYSFYIVDTFGEMREYDITRLAQLFDNNLDTSIRLGFHSHNNLQLSYSNAVAFINAVHRRKVILDSSVFGMGRGAGNLCTELITEYLNVQYDKSYRILPMLKLIDDVIKVIRNKEYWGYSPEYYLSAINKCHPSYARYYEDMNTIRFEDIDRLISSIEPDKRVDFDMKYAESLYFNFNMHTVEDMDTIDLLTEKLQGKNVLLVGTGKSLTSHRRKIIKQASDKDTVTISINHVEQEIPTDFVFISNNKRLELLQTTNTKKKTIICTSNVEYDEKQVFHVIDYSKWIYRRNGRTSDNPLMIMINLLINIGVHKVCLAGFDGFSADVSSNYLDDSMQMVISQSKANDINELLTDAISHYSKLIEISFVTPSLYDNTEVLEEVW